MDLDAARALVGGTWQSSILPALERYIAIPAKSPAFDGEWERNGHLEGAVALAAEWVEAQHLDELRLEVVRLPGRTPVLLLEAPGDVDDTVLLYGHLDKQPEMSGWAAGLGPWTPVRRGDRLYGRGGADDGYAIFAALTAIRALRAAAAAPRALRGADRGLRGERQLRPALLHRAPARAHRHARASWSASTRAAATTSSSGARRRCAASPPARCACACSTRACTRATPAASCRRASASRASSSTASRTPRPARSARASSTSRSPPSASRRRAPRRGCSAPIVHERSRSRTACTRHQDGAELVLNRTWRPVLEVTGADGLPALHEAGNVLRP